MKTTLSRAGTFEEPKRQQQQQPPMRAEMAPKYRLQAREQAPEFLTQMTQRIKKQRQEARGRLGLDRPDETRGPVEVKKAELAPHEIPFAARFLTLNLAPPHGTMPPPPPQQRRPKAYGAPSHLGRLPL
jgi:hypothetical protein